MLLHWFLGSVGLKLSLKRANFSNMIANYTDFFAQTSQVRLDGC